MIGTLVLIALVIFIKQVFFASPSPSQLMTDAMVLRTNNDTVEKAALISSIDERVNEMESDAIAAQWSTLADCIAGNLCTQDDYFDFLLMVAVEKRDEVPNSDIIVNIITINRYWGNSEKIIEFSKALSEADSQVEALQLKTLRNKWQEIVYCDGKCAEFHTLFFDFIRLLLSV
jgi:hypothetical protein